MPIKKSAEKAKANPQPKKAKKKNQSKKEKQPKKSISLSSKKEKLNLILVDNKKGPPILGFSADESDPDPVVNYAPSILQPDTPAAKHPGGRPSIYSKKLGNQIFVHMCEGLSLRAIAALPGMPAKSTILRWLFEDESKEFQDQYTRARQIQAESELDETKEIADDDTEDVRFEMVTRNHVDVEVAVFVKAAIARAGLRIQARETRLKLFNQQKYGALMRHGGMDTPDIKHSIAQEIRQAHGKEG